MIKIYVMSLGCPRNLLDSEVLEGLLEKKGYALLDEAKGADIAIVNTCGFIEDAKKESIDMILALAELKKKGEVKKLIVTGCLSQRYPKELQDEIGEIDAVFGTSDFSKIPSLAERILAGEKVKEVSLTPDFLYDDSFPRKRHTPPHYAYIKIQEGCANRCSYCVIPGIRGRLRSRSISSIANEISSIRSKSGVKEAILIGQDITSFGVDIGGKPLLSSLIKEISPLLPDGWIRLLYTHPARFDDELIDMIASTENVCKYIDLPIQHINDTLLKNMARRVTRNEIERLIARVRERIKGVVLRTSVIVGFPGETEKIFGELLDFLRDVRFERLGAFTYSREEGTPAAGFAGHVPEKIKKERFDRVMKLQQAVCKDNNLKCLDKKLRVLVDEAVEDGGTRQFFGRSYMDAPEVDGGIYVAGDDINVGEFVDVRVTGAMEYDLIGEKE